MADTVTIADASAIARYSLRMRAPLPSLPPLQQAVAFGGGDALALGPDEWLLLLPPGVPAPSIADVHSLTDVSARSIALLVAGVDAEALLQTGCPLDLALFAPGRVTRTLFEAVEIILWRRSAQEFHVEVWRSFGDYLRAALAMAAGNRAIVMKGA